jgi:hypothetical protein
VAEADTGVDSLVPTGTELPASIADGTATVDLSSPFGSGARAAVRMRLTQSRTR